MLYIHAVFHIKSTSVTIRDQDQQALYEYMGGILNRIGCLPVRINGVDDHVHLLCLLSRTVTTAKMMEEVKQRSSCWIKTRDPCYYRYFAWQNGYGAFSVSHASFLTARYRLIRGSSSKYRSLSI